MNDDPQNADDTPSLNDEVPIEPPSEIPPDLRPQRTWRDWARYIYDCNPFYLVSAALLLFGISRFSTDPGFRGREIGQLIFNFSALEIYEALLVLVALLLARRSIWYDSTLLVVLDGIFAFVPFVLITHSVLIGEGMALGLAGLGFVLAVARFGMFKWRLPQLRFPGGLLAIGVGLLLVNALVPFLLRHVIENGTDAWIPCDRWGWYIALPAAVASVNLLPRPNSWGGPAPGRSWLPLLIAGLWLSATAVHLHCLGYISELPFQSAALIPVLWVLSWTVCNRLTDFMAVPSRDWELGTLTLPALIPLGGLFASVEMVVILATANALFYGGRCFSRGGELFSLQLALASIALVIGGMPELLGLNLVAGSPQWRFLFSAGAVYMLMNGIWSRNPAVGLTSAIVLVAAIGAISGERSYLFAVQAGLVFLLVHSLRWDDRRVPYAAALRLFAGSAWVVHSYFWTQTGGAVATWTVIGGALLVLAGYAALRFLLHRQVSCVVVVAAAMAALGAPSHLAVEKVKGAPNGLLAVVGSFALLILGTIVALARARDPGCRQDSSGGAE